MPTTVKQLFNNFNIENYAQVKWGDSVPCRNEGVYIISISSEDNKLVTYDNAPIDKLKVADWISFIEAAGKNILVDKQKASAKTLADRLEKFWFFDETILYIGKAEYGKNKERNLHKRVSEYYRTPLGRCAPHAGGNWIKTLSILNQLFVFYSAIANPNDIEEDMIQYFADHVSEKSKSLLFDSKLPLPFANKEINKSLRKNHNLNYLTVRCKSSEGTMLKS